MLLSFLACRFSGIGNLQHWIFFSFVDVFLVFPFSGLKQTVVVAYFFKSFEIENWKQIVV